MGRLPSRVCGLSLLGLLYTAGCRGGSGDGGAEPTGTDDGPDAATAAAASDDDGDRRRRALLELAAASDPRVSAG